MKLYIGIDNGVSGSIGFLMTGYVEHSILIPVIHVLDYTKKKKWIHRVDIPVLIKTIYDICLKVRRAGAVGDVLAVLERPMVNPTRFVATGVALRALEATLISLESLKIPYIFIDSKEWQRSLLPKEVDKVELKKASLCVGKRLFPNLKFGSDADGILIAEYARRKQL